jgi:hypothetical protein
MDVAWTYSNRWDEDMYPCIHGCARQCMAVSKSRGPRTGSGWSFPKFKRQIRFRFYGNLRDKLFPQVSETVAGEPHF